MLKIRRHSIRKLQSGKGGCKMDMEASSFQPTSIKCSSAALSWLRVRPSTEFMKLVLLSCLIILASFRSRRSNSPFILSSVSFFEKTWRKGKAILCFAGRCITLALVLTLMKWNTTNHHRKKTSAVNNESCGDQLRNCWKYQKVPHLCKCFHNK